MSAAPPRPRQPRGIGSGKLIDLDQRRLYLLERSLEDTRSELALMEASWFHAMAEMRRLRRRLETGAAELAALRERIARARLQVDGAPSRNIAGEQSVRLRRWWERWP